MPGSYLHDELPAAIIELTSVTWTGYFNRENLL
jgi:hypothetical protein